VSSLNPFESIIKFLHLQVCIVNFNQNQAERRGVYIFRVNGELFHRIGSLEFASQDGAKFAQIYFLDDGL